MAVLKHQGNTLYLFAPMCHKSKCKDIPGGQYEKKYKCWSYPLSSLDCIQKLFPEIELPDTIRQFKELRKNAAEKLDKVKIQGGDFEHPFLMKHQKICVEIAQNRKSFAFYLGTGTGKTITSLAICDFKKGKTLVICPLAIIKSAWLDDAKNFFPHIHIVSLHPGKEKGTKAKKKILRALNSGADIFIINFEGFKILFETLKQLKLQRIIVDESSKMKNPTSQITEDIMEFSKDVVERYLLSGTPAPNTPLEYWAQIETIAPGLLGPSFYAFRNRFFTKDPKNDYRYIPIADKLEELMTLIKQVALFISKEDCLPFLPPYTMQFKDVYMTDEQRKTYKQMEELQFAELPNTNKIVLTANKLASIMKLRQITAGFILNEEKKPHFIADSKLNALKETLDEIGPESQVIIWIQFHEEVNLIKKLIETEYGSGKCRALYGFTTKIESDIERDEDTTVREAVIDGFKQGQFQYLIAHPKTAMYGLTFNNAAYAIYYSLSQSYEEFHQSRDRIHRYGQDKNVTYYFLTCVGTVDKAIYRALDRKKRVSDELLDYIRITKGGGDYDDSNDKTDGLQTTV